MRKMVITPEVAKEMLKKNTNNRPVSKRTLSRYVQLMKNGEWGITTDAIGFDVNGRLINGQHRLNAVVESGTEQEFYVIEDLPESSFCHTDGGRGGSNSKGFCFTEDAPDEAWKYLKGIVDADVCAVFEFPDGHLTESYGVYADHSDGAGFSDKVLKREWCCKTCHSSIAKVIEVKDPFQGVDYRELKLKVKEMIKLFNH